MRKKITVLLPILIILTLNLASCSIVRPEGIFDIPEKLHGTWLCESQDMRVIHIYADDIVEGGSLFTNGISWSHDLGATIMTEGPTNPISATPLDIVFSDTHYYIDLGIDKLQLQWGGNFVDPRVMIKAYGKKKNGSYGYIYNSKATLNTGYFTPY